MNDILWLANHPLRGNITGILTRQNPDTLEGLGGQLSVGVHRILAELQHSTKLELKKPYWTQMDSSGATTRTPDKPGSPPVLRTSPPSLLYKEWTWEHYM
jgi:hypothetical protein